MNFAKATLLLVCLLVLCGSASASSSNRKLTEWARHYIGHTETGKNRSNLIDRWNAMAGAAYGSSWCACFASAGLRASGASMPSYRGAWARGFLTGTVRGVNRIPASWLLNGIVTAVPIGTLIIWQRGDGWQGHVDITDATWSGSKGLAIGGNTSSGRGDLRDGDGVWRRWRRIVPASYMRITDFILVDTTATIKRQ